MYVHVYMYVCGYVCIYIYIRARVGVHMHSCRRILFYLYCPISLLHARVSQVFLNTCMHVCGGGGGTLTFEITHPYAVIFFIPQKHPKNHAYILKNKIIQYFCDHKARKILYKKIHKISYHSTGEILKKY